MFSIGQTFFSKSGDTRYVIVNRRSLRTGQPSGHVNLLVSVWNVNTAQFEHTNPRAQAADFRILEMLESGRWTKGSIVDIKQYNGESTVFGAVIDFGTMFPANPAGV